MLKRQKILIIIIFLLLMIPYRANAEATLDVKAVIDGKNSSITTPARYCYVYGCRTSITGIKVSVYVKGMEKQTKIVKNGENFAGETINYNFENIQSLSEKISLQSLNIKFQSLASLINGFKETWYYDILMSFPSLKQEFELLDNIRLDSNNIYNTIVTKNKNSSISTYEKYQQKLENSYITIEPILKVTLATNDSRDTLGIFKKYNVAKNYITIDYANQIINHGEIDICGAISDKNFNDWVYIGLLGDCSGNDKNAKCREIYNNTKESQCNASGSPYKNLTKAWNELISNKDKLKGNVQEDTVKEIAKYIMTGNNYIYAGATSDGKLSSEASGTGSISNKINDISTFIYLPSNLTTYNNKSYTKANRNGTNTWKEIAKDYSGYGIGIMVAKIGLNDSYLRSCHYENGEVILGQGMTDVTDCCEEDVWDTDEYGIFVNSDKYKSYCICTKTNYDDLIGKDNGTITEEKLKKNLPKEAKDDLKYCCKSENYGKEGKKTIEKFPKWVNSELDIDYCKGNTNNDKYCVWNGNNTERYQTVNGNELDCCSYDNWGKTNNEREQALKNADKTKIVSRNIFENEIPWYSNNCTNKYCVWNGNNTERWQTVNGNELDCCNYENWGKTNNEREQALKNADKTKTVARYIFENEIPWYSNNCTSNITTQYCTIQKLQNGDKSCCSKIDGGSGLSSYSPSFIEEIKSNGYSDTESGLKEYLINKLSSNSYNKTYFGICGLPTCVSNVENSCPNCNDDNMNTGYVKDTVSGVDSTELNLSQEMEKCIFNNSNYLAIGNSYCKIYCTEKVEYNFPKKSTLSVTAGTQLKVGENLSPVETKVTKTCRIDKLNVDQFKKDIEAARNNLVNAYRNYSASLYPLEDKIVKTENASQCECTHNTSNFKCCEEETYKTSDPVRKSESSIKFYYVPTGSKAQCQQASLDRPPYWVDGCSYEKGFDSSDCEWVGDNSAANNPHVYIATYKCGKLRPVPLDEPYCEDGTYKLTPDKNACYKYVCENSIEYYENSRDAKFIGKEVAYKDSSGEHYRYKYECSEFQDIDKEEPFYLSEEEYKNGGYKNRCKVKKCKKATCSKYNYEKYTAWSTKSYDYYKFNANRTESRSEGKVCETATNSSPLINIYESRKANALDALNTAKARYNKILSDFESCATFYNSEFSYKLEPTYNVDIRLNYVNGDYSVNTTLDKTRQEESTNNFKNPTIVDIPTYSYDIFSWPKTLTFTTKQLKIDFDITIPQSSKTVYTYTYSLSGNDSNVYKYVNKSSLSEKQKSDVNSINIGPHLPVAYNEKNKKIEVELTPIVTVNNLSKERYEFKNKLCTDSYSCEGIIPGKTKIIPVYRPISLSNPFPDEDGNGRNTGKNWCNGSDCTNNNQVVQNVIKNNRGVSEDKVYTLTPLYTLVLTPGTIKKIREYSSQTSYGDYNLVCDTNNICKSAYLRNIPDKNGEYINNNLESLGVLKKDKSCAFNEELAGCMPGDKYEG